MPRIVLVALSDFLRGEDCGVDMRPMSPRFSIFAVPFMVMRRTRLRIHCLLSAQGDSNGELIIYFPNISHPNKAWWHGSQVCSRRINKYHTIGGLVF